MNRETGPGDRGTSSPETFGCGCSGPGDIQYISIDGISTGLKGLGDLFEKLRTVGKTSDDPLNSELLEGLRRNNYIPASKEDRYIEAVREKYSAFLTGNSNSHYDSPKDSHNAN